VKAALLREYHRPLELVERPVPEIAHVNEVLVRIGGAGVCATDLHAIEGLMEPAGVSLPRVLGHENAGWVEQVGDLVTTVGPGDPVILYPPYSCGLCVPCRRGDDMHCVNHDFTGLSLDGGFAEHVLVRERSVIKLPDGLSPAEVAPHADAGLTAYHAVRRMAHLMKPGTTAVVIGIGGVGHIAVQLARELGSSRVIAIDTEDERLALARELGADEAVSGGDGAAAAVRELTGGRGADATLDVIGGETSKLALEALRVGGHAAIIGARAGVAGDLDRGLVLRKGLRVTGINIGSRAMFESMNRAITTAKLKPAVDKTFPIDDAVAAYKEFATGRHFGKVVLKI
jgi:NAD+-dependent secondary alcohol dehydrogenase Adh1